MAHKAGADSGMRRRRRLTGGRARALSGATANHPHARHAPSAFRGFRPGRPDDLRPPSRSTRRRIVAFARDWDPQPFHVDPVAARGGRSPGALIASGWHTCALMMRALAERLHPGGRLDGRAGRRGGALARAGAARRRARRRPRGARDDPAPSALGPGMGLVRFRFHHAREEGDGGATFVRLEAVRTWILFRPSRRRSVPPSPPGWARAPRRRAPTARALALPPVLRGPRDRRAGRGAWRARTFGAEEIRRLRPRLRPAALPSRRGGGGVRAIFGADSAASGWHKTGAAWIARHGRPLASAAGSRRWRPARAPPASARSPGFTNLTWSRPVYAGDTITYTSRVVDRRETRFASGLGPRLQPQRGLEPTRGDGVRVRRRACSGSGVRG